MATEVRWRRGSTAQHSSFTGAAAEVTVDTDKKTVVVHDGSTVGGTPLATEASVTNHVSDGTDAHAASAITNTPAGSIAATTVQAALNELDTEKAPLASPALTGIPTAPTAAFGTDTTQIATTEFVQDAVIAGGASTFKNKIIGGDFTTNPWQRGTSFTAPVSGTYTADRWLESYVSDAVVNVLKTADAPTVAEAGIYTAHCLHADVTTADASIAAGQFYLFYQPIEGLNAASFGFGQAGTRYVTLSFWHKHTKTGTYCVALNNSAQNRSYVAEYTQAVTDTWEKATITIPVDTTGTWLYDAGKGINIWFSVACGSTYGDATANTWTAATKYATANQVNALDSTSNNFKIALVQLEAGSVATPFEARGVGQELALCQRYYYRLTGTGLGPCGAGFNYSTSVARQKIDFPVRMRTNPTSIEQSGTASDYRVTNLTTATVCTSVPIFQNTTDLTALVDFTTGATLTAGQGSISSFATASGYLGFSAEF